MEGLGINLTWFLFQLGNFVVLLAILTYLLHKPLIKMLDERNKQIKDSLEQAEKIQADVAKTEKEQRELLTAAQKEASELLSGAKTQAKDLAEKVEQDARKRSEQILTQAEEQIQREHDQMKQELKGELANLVITASEKVLGKEVTIKDKQEQISKLVETL